MLTPPRSGLASPPCVLCRRPRLQPRPGTQASAGRTAHPGHIHVAQRAGVRFFSLRSGEDASRGEPARVATATSRPRARSERGHVSLHGRRRVPPCAPRRHLRSTPPARGRPGRTGAAGRPACARRSGCSSAGRAGGRRVAGSTGRGPHTARRTRQDLHQTDRAAR